jgi:hypothetical protein
MLPGTLQFSRVVMFVSAGAAVSGQLARAQAMTAHRNKKSMQ